MKVLTVQDIACYGKCSTTLALPVLSSLGLETSLLPTALLSTHTGFNDPFILDLTDSMEKILDHFTALGLSFDCIQIGYLTGPKQLSIVEKVLDTWPEAKVVLDPAMGDDGRLYPAVDRDTAAAFRHLAQRADLVLPNLTEAFALADLPYQTDISLEVLMEKIPCRGTRVITGLKGKYGSNDRRIAAAWQDESLYQTEEGVRVGLYQTEEMAGHYHGTGDLFAAVMTACLLYHVPASKAVPIACEFTLDCVGRTMLEEPADRQGNHWNGLHFEKELPSLINRMRPYL